MITPTPATVSSPSLASREISSPRGTAAQSTTPPEADRFTLVRFGNEGGADAGASQPKQGNIVTRTVKAVGRFFRAVLFSPVTFVKWLARLFRGGEASANG